MLANAIFRCLKEKILFTVEKIRFTFIKVYGKIIDRYDINGSRDGLHMETDNKWTDERIISSLQSREKGVICEALDCLDNVFDSYSRLDEQTFTTIMNSIISLCVSPEIYEDSDLFEKLLDTLEAGAGHQMSSCVNFDPLVGLFEKEQFSDKMWHLAIILGYSYQPKYIDYLKNIETDDSVLRKEIDDAILELEHAKKITEGK